LAHLIASSEPTLSEEVTPSDVQRTGYPPPSSGTAAMPA
jgi:hypothetical protein